MPGSRTWKVRADLRIEQLDDELLVYDPQSEHLLRLNPTGAVVWKLCDGTRSRDEIVTLLTAAWPGSTEQIEAEVDALIARLQEAGALEETQTT